MYYSSLLFYKADIVYTIIGIWKKSKYIQYTQRMYFVIEWKLLTFVKVYYILVDVYNIILYS